MDQLLAWHAQLPPEEAAPVPLDRFLPVALSTGLHDQALRIVDRLGQSRSIRRRAASRLHCNELWQLLRDGPANHGILQTCRGSSAGPRVACASVLGAAECMARSRCISGGDAGWSSANALLDGIESDARTLDAGSSSKRLHIDCSRTL